MVREGNTITQIWQVVSDGLDDEQVREREYRALHEAKLAFPSATPYLVSKTLPSDTYNLDVEVIPLWLLLMEDQPTEVWK